MVKKLAYHKFLFFNSQLLNACCFIWKASSVVLALALPTLLHRNRGLLYETLLRWEKTLQRRSFLAIATVSLRQFHWLEPPTELDSPHWFLLTPDFN